MAVFTSEERSLLYRGKFCGDDLDLYTNTDPNMTYRTALIHLLITKTNISQHIANTNNASSTSRRVEDILNSIIVPIICVFGAVGNVINLVILSHRSWQVALGRMERFVQSGLIALAVSDLCYCVSVIPMILVDQHEEYYMSYNFHVFYRAYCDGFINTFALCSTMLTVTIAIGRYFATVHPIRAREKFGMTFAKRILCGVVVLCVGLNIPRYFFRQIESVTCLVAPHNSVYYMNHEYLAQMYRLCYLCVYFVLAICVPFAVLAYCNIYLVKALKQSVSSPIIKRRTKTKHEPGSYRITLTLVIIVMAFFICVVPTETVVFWQTLIAESGKNVDKYNIIVAFFICIYSINFSFNFILYCVVNSHFRRTIYDVLRCRLKRLTKRKGSFHGASETISTGPNGNNTYNNYQGTMQMSTKMYPRKTSVTEL